MKKFLVLTPLLILALLLGACTHSEVTEKSEIQFTPGTYTAESQGMIGPVKVEVTFSEKRIEDVVVTEQNETIRIGEFAAGVMPQRIVENQSLAVDTVSSATYTSYAVLSAVEDCVEQAGGDAELLQTPVNTVSKDESFDYDLVVVGGGLSGLTAAAKAAQSGIDVALIEKAPFLGGTSVMAEGYFFSVGNDDSEGLYNLFLKRAAEAESDLFPEDNMIRTLAENNTPALDFIRSTGCDIVVLKPFTSIAVTADGTVDTSKRSAYRIIDHLKADFEAHGGMVYTSTPATSLITDNDGAVVGVISDTDRGIKTFNTKSVVLAAGDYARNKEMMEKYIPESATAFTISAVGNQGDGINMALEVGAVMYEDQYVQGGPLIFNPYDTYRGSYSNPEFLKESLLVSIDGERRVAEDQGTRPVNYANTNYDKPDGAWSIMDADSVKGIDYIDELLTRTSGKSGIQAYTADTIQELAALIDVDETTFVNSVKRYNELCRMGKDIDLGKDPSYLHPVSEGPFYAVRGYAINRGTLGGIRINEKAQVVDAQGKPINGLYAAGTMASRAFFSRTYHGGSALGISATMGFVAGEQAATECKSK